MSDPRVGHAARSSARRLSSAAAALPRVYRWLLVLSFLVVLLAPVAALAEPLAQGGTYVVQRGDTLSTIAARFGVSASSLARANGITNPNFVWVGQRLTIPGRTVPPPQPAPQPAPVPGPSGGTYIVQRGDTLSKIAARFGTTISALMAANGIRNANFIYVGQRLTVGSAGPAPTPKPQQPPPPQPPTGSKTGRWIDVDLTHQRLTAFDGQTPVFTTLVSTGLPGTPTVVGTYKIYVKLVSTRMVGPGYNLPNVPYTMYFYQGYGLHGTYWHNNFGHPMSHGCVNLKTEDAAWLFGWASVGTTVVTHY